MLGPARLLLGMEDFRRQRIEDVTALALAADQAGISRRYGGIHFEQGDLDARVTGRLAARTVWERAEEYWKGG